MISEKQPEERITCPECHAGIMKLVYLTYFTWLNKELITVQDFPAWVCDMCGRREYDTQAISWLNILLDPSTGKSASQQKSRKRQPPDRPPARP